MHKITTSTILFASKSAIKYRNFSSEKPINKHLESFFIAAKENKVSDLQRLLKIKEVRAHASANENQALVSAAENGHIDILSLLLEIPEVEKQLSLHVCFRAIENNHLYIAKYLLLTSPSLREVAQTYSQVLANKDYNGESDKGYKLKELINSLSPKSSSKKLH